MKRILISLLVLVGVGGLIGLLSYHPKPVTVGTKSSTTDPSKSPGNVAGSSTAPTGASGGSAYKDGTYTGSTVDANGYGPVQVQAVISGGKLTDVKFLQMPSSPEHSSEVTAQAKPLLLQEAIQAQSANIDTVSGATQDSQAFTQSLQDALSQAKA